MTAPLPAPPPPSPSAGSVLVGTVVGAVTEVVRMVVVEPIRGGRLRAAGWPPGLRPIVTLALTGMAVAAALVLAAPYLRSHGDLVVRLAGDLIYPRWTTPVFLVLIVLTLSLLHAACLHLAWWLRIGSLLFVWLMIGSLVFYPLDVALAPNVVSFVGSGLLLVFTVARWRASFRWWEFVTVFVVVGATAALVLHLGSREAQSLGFDPGPSVLTLALTLVAGLSVPFTFVAGLAFAQLATLLAHRVGDAVDQRVGSTRILGVVALVVGIVGAALAVRHLRQPTESGHSHPYEWGSAAVLLVLTVGVALALVLRRTPSSSRSLDVLEDAVSSVAIPAALLVTVAALPSQLATRLSIVMARLDLGGSDTLADIGTFLYRTDVLTWTRVAAGLLLVAWAVSRAPARPLPAVLAATLGLTLVVTQLGGATGGRVRLPWTTEALNDLAIVLALAVFLALAAARRLTRRRVTALGVAMGLSLAYSVRSTFDAPFVAVFGLGATAAVFIGVVWATLTDADDANGDSPGWPRPARVLLFLANALLAMVTLAFLSVSSVGEIGIDVSAFATLGDDYLGTTLLLSAYAVLTWEVATAAGRPRRSPAS